MTTTTTTNSVQDEAPAMRTTEARGASVLVAQADLIPESELGLTDQAEHLTYESVTNYARATKGAAQACVMCGCGSSNRAGACVIPRQNKDVCRDCDKAIWRHESTGAYFKWCKGCKNFLQIGNFSQKLDAAKCDKCRERGRASYLLKKRCAQTVAGSLDDDGQQQKKHSRPRSDSTASAKSSVRTDVGRSQVGYSRRPRAHSDATASVFDTHDDSAYDDDDQPGVDGLAAFSLVALGSTYGDFASGARSQPRVPGNQETDGDNGEADDPLAAAGTGHHNDRVSASFGRSLSGTAHVRPPVFGSKSRGPTGTSDDDRSDAAGRCRDPDDDDKSPSTHQKDGPPTRDDDDDAALAAALAASPEKETGDADGGLLFELAAIHSKILQLEQQADRVPKLEAEVKSLKTELSAALDREETLKARLAAIDQPSKRPRLISFDAGSTETPARAVARVLESAPRSLSSGERDSAPDVSDASSS